MDEQEQLNILEVRLAEVKETCEVIVSMNHTPHWIKVMVEDCIGIIEGKKSIFRGTDDD